MQKENLSIIITGHIDHGKSTLIGRLLLDTDSLPKEKLAEIKKISASLGKDTELAFLADQLKEEREQGMTIDTTQIFFKTRKRNYIIIDSPGHAKFIKNMITGASQANAGVLLVDVAEGLKEQTRRHAYILGMLGIDKLIVVFNKMDLINYEEKKFNEVKNELLKFLEGIGIRPYYSVPISAKEDINISKRSSANMPWYRGPCLINALDGLKPDIRIERKPLRFSIQDNYEIEGKMVTVGKVLSGTIKQGQEVILLPSLKNTRINSIKVFGRHIKETRAGKNIGLILDDPALAKRGEVIVQKEDTAKPTTQFKANIFWMSDEPLKINQSFSLRCANQDTSCIIEKIEKRIDSSTLEIIEEDARELKMNETAVVIIRAEHPLVIEKFSFVEDLGRFTLEKNSIILGMGIII
ncbi:MAG: GTP-binding protein [Candidatus Omnitrophica bacterium]|nr:GTP-binding protein [Candidatus Omnitrophota bacterium]